VPAGKAVFGVEYSLNPVAFCPQADDLNYGFLKMNLELDAWMPGGCLAGEGQPEIVLMGVSYGKPRAA
jgi:hypothetical protein